MTDIPIDTKDYEHRFGEPASRLLEFSDCLTGPRDPRPRLLSEAPTRH
jgi:hypothetical protein